MPYDTNIISIQSTTDAKNSNFDKKSRLLSNSIYQYLEHVEKKYEGLHLHDVRLSVALANNELTVYSALSNRDFNTNAAEITYRARQINTTRVVSNVNINDIKKIIMGVDRVLDPASIQIEKEETDVDVLLFCLLENLQTELHGIYALIKKMFVNIVQMSIKLYEDPEINDYKKIVFEVSINDTVKNILKMEDKFYANLYNVGEKSKIEHFVLKCRKHAT